MSDTPVALCWFCGAMTEARSHGLCPPCHTAARRPPMIRCANCDQAAPHRGRGLCGRCYQGLARTGQLPPPHHTTPEEVLSERD
jgi:NMD protein affecting ribosome stability and mRNA decay